VIPVNDRNYDENDAGTDNIHVTISVIEQNCDINEIVTAYLAKSRYFYHNLVIHLNYDLKHWFISWFRWMTGIMMLIMPWLLIFMSWFRWLTGITTLMTSWQQISLKSREFYRNSGHSPELRHRTLIISWFRSFTEITMYMMPGQLIFISWFRWNEIVTANLAK
jgi:hypothetical protein